MANVPAGNASEQTALLAAGALPVAPALPIAFTATNPAVVLSATPTAFAAGFIVQNQGATTMYIGASTAAGAGTGLAVAAGASLPIASSDASLWYAYAAAPCAGVVQGTRLELA